jgi:hypothetical protein
MRYRWLWKPLVLGAAVFGGLGLLLATCGVLILEAGHPPASVYIKDILYLGLPFSVKAAIAGALIGAAFAMTRRWAWKR